MASLNVLTFKLYWGMCTSINLLWAQSSQHCMDYRIKKKFLQLPLSSSSASSQIITAQHSSSLDGRSKHFGSSICLPFLNCVPEHLGSHTQDPILHVHRWSHPRSIVSLIWKLRNPFIWLFLSNVNRHFGHKIFQSIANLLFTSN